MKAAALVVLVACMATARAESPPIDPWTDAAWQDVFHGLPRGQVRQLHATQQLFDAQGTPERAASTREAWFEFDVPSGRVTSARLRQERRSESSSDRRFVYVYDATRLQRIDEDGQATPALTRRHDAAGRPVEQTERTGAVVARTTWRYDAAGRVAERVTDSGAGSRVQETWSYRRDGTLLQRQAKSGRLTGKTVDFDEQERPVRIRVTDAFERHETMVTYPSPTEAVHATTGFSLGRGAGPFEYRTRFRVRTPQELQRVEEPELPTLRWHERGAHSQHQETEYDAAGRIAVERQFDANGSPACTGRIRYHPAGPPLAIRHEAPTSGMPCAGAGPDMDNEIRADERGQWTEQRMTMQRPDGQRRVVSVQSRRIEYAP